MQTRRIPTKTAQDGYLIYKGHALYRDEGVTRGNWGAYYADNASSGKRFDSLKDAKGWADAEAEQNPAQAERRHAVLIQDAIDFGELGDNHGA